MGLTLIRWWMMRKVKGDVLEVSAGTGRNLPYYPLQNQTVSSLTLTDKSIPMLKEAQQKLIKLYSDMDVSKVIFQCTDAEGMCRSHDHTTYPSQKRIPKQVSENTISEPNTFEERSFDTVVDTFGLCSHENPVQALKQMAKVCKPGGRIILIEHGRSYYDWLNKMLDESAEKHHAKWGCWWNRDIDHILEQADLNVISRDRWHFGTTYVIEATVHTPS
ncbi:hypothetical protein CYMTET_27094 [Cymbomonas tetramitiformis]|uniref:S-adenosyl-L-methionine-dependent methyltransferase n=1 Tax=Cymbomonas tetramitiformis TaxID=36881 RepID=A0AAE0FQY8_9CHLO|nr:hypothetical protein CYMTET_27094 [Cymbomonas tetramitiformis]